MLRESKCWTRRCINFIGVRNDGDESTERNYCKAFQDGIPNEIAYGDNLHVKPFKNDNGIQYEKAASEDAFFDREG
jgi:hypothetical protein